jgi:hypothetical protein
MRRMVPFFFASGDARPKRPLGKIPATLAAPGLGSSRSGRLLVIAERDFAGGGHDSRAGAPSASARTTHPARRLAPLEEGLALAARRHARSPLAGLDDRRVVCEREVPIIVRPTVHKRHGRVIVNQ